VNIEIYLVMHAQMANAFFTTITDILGRIPVHLHVLEWREEEADSVLNQLCSGRHPLGDYEDVILVSDLCGGTPSNQAIVAGQTLGIPVLVGANLALLIRLLNYPDSDRGQLLGKAIQAGRNGIRLIDETGVGDRV